MRVQAQTTPFNLPFEITDLTRDPNLYKKSHEQRGARVDPREETDAFRDGLQGMADPSREFRRHLVEVRQEDIDNLDSASNFSRRMSLLMLNNAKRARKPSGKHDFNAEVAQSFPARIVGQTRAMSMKVKPTNKLNLLRDTPEDQANIGGFDNTQAIQEGNSEEYSSTNSEELYTSPSHKSGS